MPKFEKLATHRDGPVTPLIPCRSNVGATASPAPNGFTDMLPANLTFVGPVLGAVGAPAGEQLFATGRA